MTSFCLSARHAERKAGRDALRHRHEHSAEARCVSEANILPDTLDPGLHLVHDEQDAVFGPLSSAQALQERRRGLRSPLRRIGSTTIAATSSGAINDEVIDIADGRERSRCARIRAAGKPIGIRIRRVVDAGNEWTKTALLNRLAGSQRQRTERMARGTCSRKAMRPCRFV